MPHFDFWYALGAVDFCFDYDLHEQKKNKNK